MVTQFDETGAKPVWLLSAQPEGQAFARPAQCRIDPQSHSAIRRPKPANARQYDAILTFWVEVPVWGNSLKRNKKGGLRMQSPASQQPRSPDLRCK